MAPKQDDRQFEARMDAAGMYREESFTDRKVGGIRRLVPIKSDGSPDSSRAVAFVGQTQVLTSMGALPLTFEIDAQSLEEAVERFPAAAKVAFERTVREFEEMRRQAASSIVIPERGAGGLGPGGLPGGGKIQIP
jgi:hypothetical protein